MAQGRERREGVGMGESVSCVLLVTYVLVVSTSRAQGDGESWVPIKFPSEDGKPSIPQTSTARFAPGDHTTSAPEQHAIEDPARDSLQVCKVRIALCRYVRSALLSSDAPVIQLLELLNSRLGRYGLNEQ
jgi:hypothetical protein